MRTKAMDWLDTDSGNPMYGLQVLVGGKWKNLAENGRPCLYTTEAERDAKRAEYSKKRSQP